MVEGVFTIPVRQEELHVGTRTVDTGGVRITTPVAGHPVEIDQILHHNALTVPRVPVDRIVAADDAPATRHEGDTLIIPVLIHITKAQRETRHAETVFLKSEEVCAERFEDAPDT